MRISQHRPVLCYILLSVWIFLLIAGMQRYIAGNWIQTNVNLNTIYMRNEINVLSGDKHLPEGGTLLEKLQSAVGKATNRKLSWESKLCNPAKEIRSAPAQEGGVLEGWKLQGIIAVTRHGDRGPMVHVRDAESVDCGVPANENPFLDRYRTFLNNNNSTLNSSMNHMTWLKTGPFHGFPVFPTTNQCHLAQLTQRGVEQHLLIGNVLRKAYGVQLGLMTKSNSAESVVVYSTRYKRTFQASMALLFALLPAEKWLAVNVRVSHSLTFCFGDCSCPRGDKLKGSVNAALEKEHSKMKPLVKFMEDRLLMSPGNRFHHSMGIRDALMLFTCHNAKIPCEQDLKDDGGRKGAKDEAGASELDIINIDQDSNSPPNAMAREEKAEAEDENDDGSNDININFTDHGTCIQDHHVDQLMQFTEGLLVKVRQNPEMKLTSLLRAYGFLRNVVNYMLKMISGSNIKMVLYSGHDLTIEYLLSALGLNGEEFVEVPYATRTIFEVYKSDNDQGQFYFRVVHNGIDVTRSVAVCEGARSLRLRGVRTQKDPIDLCPIENIIRYIHDDYFAPMNATNFKDACFRV